LHKKYSISVQVLLKGAVSRDFLLFATGINNTSGKFASGVNDTGGK
jgi:hypothetical protein